MQRVDQRRAPAGVVVAQPGQFHVPPDPGQQLRGRERLDQIVVRAGLQALDGGLLPGPGRQQQHRHVLDARFARSAPTSCSPSRPGIMTSLITRSDGLRPDRVQRGLPVRHRGDLVAAPQQPLQVLAHVGVVVGEQHPGRGTPPGRVTGPGTRIGGRGRRGLVRLVAGQPAERLGQERIGRGRDGFRAAAAARLLVRQVLVAERKPDGDGGAGAFGAFGGDAAAVQPDELTHQRQADAAALVGPGARGGDAVEALEQARHLGRGDPAPGVADPEHRAGRPRPAGTR